MKQVDFEWSKAQWDRFRAFHRHIFGGDYNPLFIQFSTGELIAHGGRWQPSVRGHHSLLNIGVYRSTDGKLPPLFLDPNLRSKVKPDEIERCLLLVDRCTGHAVRMDYNYYEEVRLIPHHLQSSAAAYIPGPGQPPIGRSRIMLRRDYLMAPGDRAHVRMLINATKAAYVLKDGPKPVKGETLGRNGFKWIGYPGDYFWTGHHPEPVSNLIGKEFADLKEEQRVRIVLCGTTTKHSMKGKVERLYTQPMP